MVEMQEQVNDNALEMQENVLAFGIKKYNPGKISVVTSSIFSSIEYLGKTRN